jgi:hypothetical protein
MKIVLMTAFALLLGVFAVFSPPETPEFMDEVQYFEYAASFGEEYAPSGYAAAEQECLAILGDYDIII